MLRDSAAYTVVAILLLAMGACAHTREPKLVSDADFGRLPPDQTRIVDQARDEQQAAREELARATLNLQQAREQLQLARAEQPAAKADEERAKALANAANESREPLALERAAAMKDQAAAHRRAAKTHVDWATKFVEAGEARVTAAQKRLAMADARVDESRLVALQQANVPASTKYDVGALKGRVEARRQTWVAAQRNADRLDAQARMLLAEHRDAESQFRAEATPRGPVGSPPLTGTGTR